MTTTPQDVIAQSVSIRSKAVAAVHSPLGFFVLALTIVETFLLGAGAWFGLPDTWKVAALGVGVLLFLIVFATVVWLVVTHPENLVFSEESHVQTQAMRMFGTDTHVVTGADLDRVPAVAPPNPPVGQLAAGGTDKP
jgi:hypothetical protein